MSKRQRLSKPVAVRQVLEGLIRPGEWQSLEQRRRLRAVWEAEVPLSLQAHARLVDFVRRELWVEVSASPWVQELQFLKPRLLESFARALGSGVVRDVRFRVGGGVGGRDE
jgi:predicted nucleic acid-binding Zn ribbon protein